MSISQSPRPSQPAEMIVRARNKTRLVRIAIADDDPDCLQLMQAILTMPSFDVVTADSGAGLVILLTRGEPLDLIVTDIDMPWAEGFDVIHSARASRVDTPVLFVTGVARPNLAEAVAELGNSRLLRKPITVSGLREAVAEMLAHRS
jgi:DNA-binding response OmpR family regulator